MNNTADRGIFVKFAVLARSANVAFFRAHQAEMYANLNKVTPVERFVASERMPPRALPMAPWFFASPWIIWPGRKTMQGWLKRSTGR